MFMTLYKGTHLFSAHPVPSVSLLLVFSLLCSTCLHTSEASPRQTAFCPFNIFHRLKGHCKLQHPLNSCLKYGLSHMCFISTDMCFLCSREAGEGYLKFSPWHYFRLSCYFLLQTSHLRFRRTAYCVKPGLIVTHMFLCYWVHNAAHRNMQTPVNSVTNNRRWNIVETDYVPSWDTRKSLQIIFLNDLL